MSAETEILSAAAAITGADRIGALETGDRTAVMTVSGKRLVRYMDGSEKMPADIMIGGRDTDQQALMSDMDGMCGALCSKARTIRENGKYAVISARPVSSPAPYGMSAAGKWFYKAVVQLIYIRYRS